jgi:hypothetical protein
MGLDDRRGVATPNTIMESMFLLAQPGHPKAFAAFPANFGNGNH